MEGKVINTLERGDIYFIYRPKVGEFAPKSHADVQRFYMILKLSNKNLYRLIVIAKKRLPTDDVNNQKFWGYIEVVAQSKQAVEEEFKGRVYATKTVGERGQPSGRPAGEGIYEIVAHKDHTHLVYSLSLPVRLGEVQRELGIRREANYIISAINPLVAPPQDADVYRGQKAYYPQKLQDMFGKRRYSKVLPTTFLNYPCTALLFITVEQRDIFRELGIELEPKSESEDTARVFQDLKLERTTHRIEPLLRGKWA